MERPTKAKAIEQLRSNGTRLDLGEGGGPSRGNSTLASACPFHKLELREISELPATRMLGSSSCRTFRGSASALLRGIGVSWREVP